MGAAFVSEGWLYFQHRLPLSTCAFHPPLLGWYCFHLPPFCGSGSTSSSFWWCRLPPSLLSGIPLVLYMCGMWFAGPASPLAIRALSFRVWHCGRSTVIFSDKQNWWKAPRQRHSHKAEALDRLTAFAVPSASALQSSTATFEEFSATAIGVSAARFFLGAGAFLTQVQGQTRKCAWPFWLPSLATFRHALQKGAAFAGSARGVPLEIKAFETDANIERPSHMRHLPPKKASYSTSIGRKIGSPWHLLFDERSPWHLLFDERRLTW